MSWSLYNVYINSSHWVIPTIPKDPKRINTHQGTAANQGKEKNSQIINHGKNKTEAKAFWDWGQHTDFVFLKEAIWFFLHVCNRRYITYILVLSTKYI